MSISKNLSTFQRFLFVLPILLSLYLIVSGYSRPGVTADGQVYLQIARNLQYGIGLGWQALWVPPLHSTLIALVAWLPGAGELRDAAGIVGAVMGIGLTAAVYFLAAEIFDRRVALTASLITALFPHFLWISKSPEAEITYTALLIFSLGLVCRALRKESLPLSALAGMFLSLSYLARSEGFLIVLFVLGASLAVRGRAAFTTGTVRLTAVILICFFVCSLPYLLFLKRHYGAWVISPKTSYVLIWMKSRIYKDNDKGEMSNEDLWGLNREGKLKWQEPLGFRDLAGYLLSQPEKSLRVYWHNLKSEIPGRIPNNSGTQHYPQVFPVILALAALLAAFQRWGEDSRRKKAILLAPFAILFILPLFTDGWWKYLLPYAPLVIITGCAGFFLTADRLSRRFTALPSPALTATSALPWLTCITLACWFQYSARHPVAAAPQTQKELTGRITYNMEAEKAGRWIAQTLGPGRHYMVVWNKMIYHLDGLWTAEPVTNYASKIWYARNNGVEFYLREYFNDLTPMTEIMSSPPGLDFQALYRSPDTNYTVAIYRVVGY